MNRGYTKYQCMIMWYMGFKHRDRRNFSTVW